MENDLDRYLFDATSRADVAGHGPSQVAMSQIDVPRLLRIIERQRAALAEAMDTMTLQEDRERGEAHLSSEGFYPIWREAIDDGRKALEYDGRAIHA